jgi:hypothetical protein
VKRITPEQLPAILAQLSPRPRIIASGNFATPHTLLRVASEQLPEFTIGVDLLQLFDGHVDTLFSGQRFGQGLPW